MLHDSEGAGKFRGAPGTYAEYGPMPGATMQVSYMTDGSAFPAPGARGGGHGSRVRQMKRMASGELVPEGPTGPVHMVPGESIVALGPGGGGYGRPWERDLDRVRKDLVEEWISRERAETVYGVVFTEGGEIDLEATRLRRERLTAEAGPWKPGAFEVLSAEEILRRCREAATDIPYLEAKQCWW